MLSYLLTDAYRKCLLHLHSPLIQLLKVQISQRRRTVTKMLVRKQVINNL